MASCLYECLCEAELEKYYPNFTALGFQRIDELAKISMRDYSELGVHNMKDRKRLFQLVRIIKTLQAEEEAAGRNQQHFQMDGAAYLQPPVTRSGPRRQLHFDSLAEEREGRKSPETGLCMLPSSVNEEKDDAVSVLSHDTEYERPRKDSLYSSATWTDYQVGSPVLSSCNDVAPLLVDSEAHYVQRVAHISGYNYGVPRSCTRVNAPEKEAPWTEKEKIRVCVRKRPLGLKEERRGELNVVTVEDRDTLLLHEKKEAVDLTQYVLQHVFYFDEVFGEACSNQDVYMKTAHPLIQHIFNGENATCFAYGQTGAGKTYTMIGTHQNPGLYALAAKDIFKQLEASQTGKDLHVWISFYEIYCGQLYDLLNGRKRLFAREDSKHVVQIVGLREIQVNSVGLLLEVILKGGKERSTGATGVNSDSSRSHAIIQIQVKDSANRVFGRISFIDLAGSERAADARDSDRQTKMEGAEINQSLLALKECIRALDQDHAHTPFRQSKLTQVLKDSFIGNSKTCMIANISPSHVATEHTLNTLRYADRVKELKRGMKCCTPVVSRRRPTGNISPKRIQSSPSVQAGEKSSPKKVKLGLQHPAGPSTSSRLKASPLLFRPLPPTFSSTPKGLACKGPLGAPWVGRSSPVKGILRAGGPAKKATDGPVGASAHNRARKDLGAKREGGQGERPPVKGLKVQPVQKRVVSRADFSFGDAARPAAHPEHAGSLFAEQCMAAWTGLPLHQKEREQHLRLYHQQFQQPPILQQKLNYQPLEKLLARYKPQEIRVKEDPPYQGSGSPPYRDETMQLEELDDSDFSEDSFSLGPSQGEAEAEAHRECDRGSFFLHQGEYRDERWEVQGGQELFAKPCDLENQEAASSRVEEAAASQEDSRGPSEWNAEDVTTVPSSPKNDTPEKPYCSQRSNVARNDESTKEALAGPKPPAGTERALSCPDEQPFPGPEEATQSPPFAHKPGSTHCVADRPTEGSLQGHHPPGTARKICPQKGRDLGAAPNVAVGSFSAVEMSPPLSVSLLNAGMTDPPEEDQGQRWQGQAPLEEEETIQAKKPFYPRKGWDEDTNPFPGSKSSPTSSACRIDHWRRTSGQVLSPEAVTKWLSEYSHFPKVSSALGAESALSEHGGCVCGSSAGDAGLANLLSLCTEKEGTLFLGKYVTSPQYDADAEVAVVASLNSSRHSSLEEEDGPKATVPLQYLDVVGKSFLSNDASLLHPSGNEESSPDSLSLQTGLAFGTLEVGQPREAFQLVFSSEEMGLLKDKPTKIMFAHPPDPAEQNSEGIAKGRSARIPKNSPNGCCQLYLPGSSHAYKEALGRQFVLQIHRKQLDEMAGLCVQEESLICRMPDLDFEDFVMKLDRILALKSKCVQGMRTQLQPFLSPPSGGTPPS
ncbi:kinesin-like protein KIF24 [Pogona vitticeps]